MDEVTTLRFSTGSLPIRDRVEVFREIFGRTILKIEMQPVDAAPLEVDMVLQAIPGFGMASGRLSPMANRHTAGLLDNDDLVLVVMQSGHGIAQQCGREAAVSGGQAILTANGEVASFSAPVETCVTNFRLSRCLLAPLVADPESALLRPLDANAPALRLLTGYAAVLADMEAIATPDLRRAVVAHLHELAALAIGGTRDVLETAKNGGIRAARLHAIKSDIVRNLGERSLSSTSLAMRHGVSSRYIRQLFELEGTTVAEFVLHRRLAKAQEMLVDPRYADSKIMTIAFEVGFGDMSYFDRTFRRRYGATPSDIRDAARRNGSVSGGG